MALNSSKVNKSGISG
jgi:hypothetical protein